MNIIKGFALNRAFFDNSPGVVSNIGELASIGFTFTKEHPVYSDQGYPTISFVHFPSPASDVGVEQPLPQAQTDQVLKVCTAIYDLTRLKVGQVVTPGEFVEAVNQSLGAAVADVTVGATVMQGTHTCVQFVSWTNKETAVENINRVWFSNEAFLGQFDEYSFEVVLPIVPADAFFGHPDDVKDLLSKFTYAEEIERIQEARGKYPETVLWGNTYDYVNPVNKQDRTPAKFPVLIYGFAGNNIDLIKEAIVNKLLDGSAYTRDQWKEILPDLFRRTEFLIFPQWDSVAIENLAGQGLGYYSPILNMAAALDKLVLDSGADYDDAYVRSTGQGFAFPYQSIALLSIGNVENRDDKTSIRDWFPDFFFTGITSFDFDRMSDETKEWVRTINTMLIMAEKLRPGESLPAGYSRTIINGKTFLAKNYLNVNWKVCVKLQS